MFQSFKGPRRVVITGIGCATPIGVGRAAFWNGLRAGSSGTRAITSFQDEKCPVKIAGEVTDFDWQAELSSKDRKHVPRTVPLALAAARGAVDDAGLDLGEAPLEVRRSIGVQIGTGGGGLS